MGSRKPARGRNGSRGALALTSPDALRHERYRFKPVRRTWIPKKNGKKRPLGLPSWSGKLIGEVIRLLLEAYYEPQFSDRSYGFRPGRGCHSALRKGAATLR